MAVVTISRQFGAGAWTLGERLSKKLDYRYVHEDMIKEVATTANVSSDQIRVPGAKGRHPTDKIPRQARHHQLRRTPDRRQDTVTWTKAYVDVESG